MGNLSLYGNHINNNYIDGCDTLPRTNQSLMEVQLMIYSRRFLSTVAIILAALVLLRVHIGLCSVTYGDGIARGLSGAGTVSNAIAHDVSQPLASLAIVRNGDGATGLVIGEDDLDVLSHALAPEPSSGYKIGETVASILQEVVTTPLTSASVEQTEHGTSPPPEIVASFNGLGEGFEGPQGTARFRNPSDNSLAVGPDHIVQIVNTRMAIFTKKGSRFDTTGEVLYGPVPTNNVFRGFGDGGEINNGDAVVRYDQLADRWLIVMPIFRRLAPRENEPTPGKSGGPAQRSQAGVEGQPGAAEPLYQPPRPTAEEEAAAAAARGQRRGQGQRRERRNAGGSYAICYAISTSPDPLGSYYRYEFLRPLFPDYPRPAVWPDGYYVPTSTGDNVIQKHAYVAEREKMLRGEPATEQGFIIDGVNFLNNADLDGKQLPPAGAPNIMMATGGAQLKDTMQDDGIYVWKFHVDWDDPSRTKLDGPVKIPVAPYQYLGGGQLTNAVPQPGTERRLDAQGDKIMQRLVYRRIGDRESIVAVHSVSTSAGGGGVRWYEFRLDEERNIRLYQQGTYCPDGSYRWMASPAIDAMGNIVIGYSFGGPSHFPGQRFAGRLSDDPLGILTLREVVLVEGEAAQTNTFRWEDYAQTAIDPTDDRTIWYVGDYLKKGATNYSTRIGAFRMPGETQRDR